MPVSAPQTGPPGPGMVAGQTGPKTAYFPTPAKAESALHNVQLCAVAPDDGLAISPTLTPPAIPRPGAGLSIAPAHHRALVAPGPSWGRHADGRDGKIKASPPAGERLATDRSGFIPVPGTRLLRLASHPHRLRRKLETRQNCRAVGQIFPLPWLRDRCWSCW